MADRTLAAMRIVRGLTLIELLVVLAIVSVLASLAAPGLRELLARHAVNTAVSAFTADLHFARAQALKLGHSVTICASANGTACDAQRGSWHRGWIVFPAAGDTGSTAATTIGAGGILRVQGALAGLAGLESPGGADSTPRFIRFNGRGVVNTGAGGWRASAGTGAGAVQRLLCVSLQGRVTVRPPGEQACPA